MNIIPGFVTVPQLAEQSRLTPAGVRYHCREGWLSTAATHTGRDWLIPEESARQFLSRLKDHRSKVVR